VKFQVIRLLDKKKRFVSVSRCERLIVGPFEKKETPYIYFCCLNQIDIN
jgi:hypothetical protein